MGSKIGSKQVNKRARKPLVIRFWTKVNIYGPLPHAKAIELYPEIAGTQCWLWVGKPNHNGYPQIQLGERGEGVKIATHVSWFLEHGVWPDSSCLLHKCDNSMCIRTLHLFQGDRTVNMADKCAKGRAKSWTKGKHK